MKLLIFLIALAYSGGIMAVTVDEYIKQLEELTGALERPVKLNAESTVIFQNIENETLKEINKDLFKTAVASTYINSKYDFAFLGHEALSLAEIQATYIDKTKEGLFFGSYSVDNDFNVGGEDYLYIEDSLKQELSDPIKVTNLSKYLPLFRFQSDYIVADITSGEICVIFNGYSITTLAPNITAHLDDLIAGLKKGVYRIDEHELVYPTAWHNRRKVLSGELLMDEYGEVSMPR